jgi:sigma-B regulation protein RsbU (phosphoserine phosphatase)
MNVRFPDPLVSERRLEPVGRFVHETTLDREDLEQASGIQRRFLPVAPSGAIGGVRLAAAYRPARGVGGDFYGLAPAREGALTVIIGDVAGKGVAAALLMSRVTSAFDVIAPTDRSPSEILAALDRSLAEHAPDDRFVTAMCVRLEPQRRRAIVANAGHLPLLVRRPSGRVTSIGRPTGPPLGMAPGSTWVERTFRLMGDDLLLLMTDGVTETLHHDADVLGGAQLRALVAGSRPDVDDLCGRVMAAVESADAGRHVDDVTVVALRTSHPGPPETPPGTPHGRMPSRRCACS